MSDKKTISTEQKQKNKQLLKRIIIILIVVFIILVAVYATTGLLSKKVGNSDRFIEQIEEVYPTYTPFPAEWNVNLENDEEYLSLNTAIMYGEGESGSVYSLEDFYTQMNPGQRFFVEYFRVLREGDSEKYSSLFTEEYKKVDPSKRFEKNTERQFPPQRVHDITIRQILAAEGTCDGKKCLNSVYWVDYKINKNNNLFRNDIGWNYEYEVEISRPLYFELVTFDAGTASETTYICNMYTESSMKAYADKTASAKE